MHERIVWRGREQSKPVSVNPEGSVADRETQKPVSDSAGRSGTVGAASVPHLASFAQS